MVTSVYRNNFGMVVGGGAGWLLAKPTTAKTSFLSIYLISDIRTYSSNETLLNCKNGKRVADFAVCHKLSHSIKHFY